VEARKTRMMRRAFRGLSKGFATCLVLYAVFMFTLGGLAYGLTAYHAAAVTPATRGVNLEDSKAPQVNTDARIAIVEPIFTATAYSNAFYVFYAKYATSTQPYITTDLNYFNVTVKYGWGYSYGLYCFLASEKSKQQGLVLGNNVVVIDEINVTNGGLFHSGKRIYDVLILGFTEYVTSREYYAYKDFVAEGGTLIIMDGCNFLAEVKYYPPATPGGLAYLSLVKGHGWEFNGTHAWKSDYARWWDENKNWVGSNYWHWWTGKHYDCFVANTSHPISIYLRSNYGCNIATSYGAHEENLLQNFTNTGVIGYWHFINPVEAPNSTIYPGQPIAAYQHMYMNGSVFHAGIMASDGVYYEEFLQAFLTCAVKMGLAVLRDPTLSASMEFYDTSGARRDANSGLSGKVFCVVTLNNSSIAHGGTIYYLGAVVLKIYDRSGYSPNYTPPSPPIIIQATKADSTGLRWQAIVDTTSIPNGTYAFEFDSTYVSSVDNQSSISQLLVFGYSSVANGMSTLRPGLVALSASVVVAILTYVFFQYRKDTRGRNIVGKRSKANTRRSA
jgi:hypothetical protein